MAWRYKSSKFKNTTPTLAKKEDTIYDLPIKHVSSANNGIAASTQYLAFHIDAEGGKLGVLPVTARGRHTRNELSVVCAHASDVADFTFMPYTHDTLVTGARDDNTVKVWALNGYSPEDDGDYFTTGAASAEVRLSDADNGVWCLAPHSTAAGIVAVGTASAGIDILDIDAGRSALVLEGAGAAHADSLSWDETGNSLAAISQSATSGGLTVAVYDVRAQTAPVKTIASHAGSCRESRVLYLHGTGKLLTSGFNSRRIQEILLFDVNNLDAGVSCRQEFEGSTGLLMPLYDTDTRLVSLVGKGAKGTTCMEVLEREQLGSWLGMVSADTVFPSQSLGACLSPKSSMDVMTGEVQRLWQLARGTVTPVPCIVPRRTYRNFIAELYPDTIGQVAGCSAQEWLQQKSDQPPPKFSLNPAHADKFNVEPVAQTKPKTTAAASTTASQPKQPPQPAALQPAEKAELFATPTPAAAKQSTPDSVYETPMTSLGVGGGNVNAAAARLNNGLNDTPSAPTQHSQSSTAATANAPRTLAVEDDDDDDDIEDRPIPPHQSRKVSFGYASLIVSPDKTPSGVLPLNDSLAAQEEHDSYNHTQPRPPTPPPVELPAVPDASESVIAPDSVRRSVALFESPDKQSETPPQAESSRLGVPESDFASRLNNNSSWLSHASELDDSLGDLPFTTSKHTGLDDQSVVKRRGRESMDVRERPVSQLLGVGATSKFRHCEVKPGGKEEIFTALRQVHTGLPLECDGLQVSSAFAAVALTGPGGLIQIHKLDTPTKVDPGVLYGLENGALVTDYRWCPHHPNLLAVGCANGIVNIWKVPDGGITDETLREPYKIIRAENGKVVNVRWHPTAEGLILITTSANSCLLFDINQPDQPALTLFPHPQHIHSVCWSAGGRRLATITADGTLRLFDPRLTQEPTKVAKVIDKTRAARVLFACDDRVILIVHFAGCERKVSLFDSGSAAELTSLVVDRASSQLLVPHFDQDSCVLLLTAKGDRTVHIYEVRSSTPHLLPCTPYQAPVAHQSLAIHQKDVCNIRRVEFMRAWRLTKDTLEPLRFHVPRVNKDLFANDIFPDALVTWRASMTAADWLNGAECRVAYESLRPDGMQNAVDLSKVSANGTLSSTINGSLTHSKTTHQNGVQHNGDAGNGKRNGECNNNGDVKQKLSLQRQVESSLSRRIDQLTASGAVRDSLEQDHMEGVHPSEWDD